MTRRQFTLAPISAPLSAAVLRAEKPSVTLTGTLTTTGDNASTLTLADGRGIKLEGDDQTTGVLHDARLNGLRFEVVGTQEAHERFRILPIHNRAMYVLKDGRKLFVTYWCAVCAIRTYTPGICWCCQDETALDFREKLDHSNS